MTLIYEPDLTILKTYPHTKNELSTVKALKLKLKLKINLYSVIKSEDSEALVGGTSRLSEYGEIKMF